MADELSRWTRIRQPFQTRLFRAVLSVVLLVVVVFILYREIKPEEIESAFAKANLWWVGLAAVFAALSWVGAAIPLVALANIKISLKDATLVQVAASFVSVAAPMGLGPIALHLRYLGKRGLNAASSTAIVLFIEAAQVVTSFVMLGVALLFDHDFPKVKVPARSVAFVLVIVAVSVLLSLIVPWVRRGLKAKATAYFAKIRPQFAWVRAHPKSVVWALFGVFIQTGTYALALVFCLQAMGHPISIAMGVTIYLVGNTLGSAVPTPGGISSTLAALVAALHLVGVPTAIAASAVVLYRLVSFYVQVPIGFAAFEYMQRKQLL